MTKTVELLGQPVGVSGEKAGVCAKVHISKTAVGLSYPFVFGFADIFGVQVPGDSKSNLAIAVHWLHRASPKTTSSKNVIVNPSHFGQNQVYAVPTGTGPPFFGFWGLTTGTVMVFTSGPDISDSGY